MENFARWRRMGIFAGIFDGLIVKEIGQRTRAALKTDSMPPNLLRVGQVLMLLVLFAASGGHWMALQSLAWTRMLMS